MNEAQLSKEHGIALLHLVRSGMTNIILCLPTKS